MIGGCNNAQESNKDPCFKRMFLAIWDSQKNQSNHCEISLKCQETLVQF